jgi:hypothetical protein
VSSSFKAAPSCSAINATVLHTLPRCVKVGDIVDIVLKVMTSEAAPPLRTQPLTPSATERASKLPDQGCALYE